MFDQNLAHAAGDRLSVRYQKRAKSDSQMSALQIGASMLFLATLAAAYAEAGDFPRAVAAAEEALSVACSLGDTDAIKLSENILASVRANVPYRHEPEQ
jgi:ADP-dependent phosphofructokinase/glucokinase